VPFLGSGAFSSFNETVANFEDDCQNFVYRQTGPFFQHQKPFVGYTGGGSVSAFWGVA
jgi:hypothetical protein